MNHVFYYKETKTEYYIIYNPSTDKFQFTLKLPKNKTCHELMNGYEQTKPSLKHFSIDFWVWCSELKSNKIKSINYAYWKSSNNAVYNTFMSLCSSSWLHHEPIYYKEYKWADDCHNGGLTYASVGTFQAYGYDFSGFYPSLLVDPKFQIPTKEGTESILFELPTKLKVGYYKIIIQSDDDNFNKIFAYSKKNTYTNYTLAYAIEKQKQFKISIKLVQNGKPNCYLYDDTYLQYTHKIFDKWYTTLKQIKQVLPQNKLVKHLFSSIGGNLAKKNCIYKTDQEIKHENLILCWDDSADWIQLESHKKPDESEYHTLQSTKQPQKTNMRLYSFLVSIGRNKIGDIGLTNLDGILAIQTDGILFSEPMTQTFEGLRIDDSKTGLIDIKHCNSIIKLD